MVAPTCRPTFSRYTILLMFAKGTFHFPLSQVKTNAAAPDVSKVPCCFSGIEPTVPPTCMARLPSAVAVNGVADTKQQATITHKALFMEIASQILLKTKLLSRPQ